MYAVFWVFSEQDPGGNIESMWHVCRGRPLPVLGREEREEFKYGFPVSWDAIPHSQIRSLAIEPPTKHSLRWAISNGSVQRNHCGRLMHVQTPELKYAQAAAILPNWPSRSLKHWNNVVSNMGAGRLLDRTERDMYTIYGSVPVLMSAKKSSICGTKQDNWSQTKGLVGQSCIGNSVI